VRSEQFIVIGMGITEKLSCASISYMEEGSAFSAMPTMTR
jgi:hypothetical protein